MVCDCVCVALIWVATYMCDCCLLSLCDYVLCDFWLICWVWGWYWCLFWVFVLTYSLGVFTCRWFWVVCRGFVRCLDCVRCVDVWLFCVFVCLLFWYLLICFLVSLFAYEMFTGFC